MVGCTGYSRMDHQHCQTCYGLALSLHVLAGVRQAAVSLTHFPPTLSKIGETPTCDHDCLDVADQGRDSE